jgi:AraC family transcriptional regulator, regulatory protein of adaptative response / DNA-3-methyladenine glycosylase II
MRLRAAHAPYDPVRLLWFLGLHAVPGVESWDGRSYARVLRLPAGPGTVRLTSTDGGYDAELRLADPGRDGDPAMAQLAHLLDLDGDPGPAVDHLDDDPVLGPLVRARPGLRTPGSVDHVETLVRTIIGQQISVSGARTVTARVVATQGVPLAHETAVDGLTHSFPTAASLAAADPESLPMPRARGRSVAAVARAVLDVGESIADGRPEHAPALLELPGIGPWTAAYVAWRSARDPDVFLPTDLGVRRSFERHGQPGDPGSVAVVAQAWSPHRSLALIHLWTDLLESRTPLSDRAGKLSAC